MEAKKIKKSISSQNQIGSRKKEDGGEIKIGRVVFGGRNQSKPLLYKVYSFMICALLVLGIWHNVYCNAMCDPCEVAVSGN